MTAAIDAAAIIDDIQIQLLETMKRPKNKWGQQRVEFSAHFGFRFGSCEWQIRLSRPLCACNSVYSCC